MEATGVEDLAGRAVVPTVLPRRMFGLTLSS
jgi:hypothetical protein